MTKEDILNYLTQHKQEFREKYDVEKIGLFGSCTRGEECEEGDIDIFVMMKPDLLEMVGLNFQRGGRRGLAPNLDKG